VGFFLSSALSVPLSLVAMAGGSFALFVFPLLGSVKPHAILAKVDWSILLFFIGLFIVLQGFESSGLMGSFTDYFQKASNGAVLSTPWLVFFAALLANLISNVPAVLLVSPLILASGQREPWLVLAAGSTLSGNATIVGAAANVIVVQEASHMGVEIPTKQFMMAGVPIALVTLLVAIAYFLLL